MSITRHHWLGKTTKCVLIKSCRPIKVPQNAFIVLMIHDKIQQRSTQHASAPSCPCREAMLIYRSITLNFPTRVINWKTLTTSLSWLYIYHYNWAAKCIFKFHWTNPTISKVKNINLHEISVNIIRGDIFVITPPPPPPPPPPPDIAWFK